ncbi:hypothetical protein [Sphingomonas mesophila]|uniref:hypothetical protein n=1 Tax=Sphingomonas mesophila TaxID=2303576 RepID=UPI001F078AB6|nr:hypothetical protein [Sphingomonas mesophila]
MTSLLLAACARTPAVEPVRAPVTVPRPTGELVGLSAAELGQRFGAPRLTIKEGSGTKLQWVANGCVLDAYLYPAGAGGGVERVTHVDARRPSGDDLPLATCLTMMR